MGNDDERRCIFPLTSLQIGDLQSYLSDLSLFIAIESNKFYILVDNRPWLRDRSRPAHFWQFMVTKSRLSPFANTKARKERKEDKEACPVANTGKQKRFSRWFPLIDAALSQKKVLLPVKKLRNSLLSSSELHRTLYGFIVFEVAWSDVRGINYLNELQTDTSLAIEAKFMQRWEFDSISQAASCISSWFSGTLSDQLLLTEYLDSAIGEVFYDAEDVSKTSSVDDDGNISDDNLPTEDNALHWLGNKYSISMYPKTSENETGELHTPPPPTGPYKRRKVSKSIGTRVEVGMFSEENGDSETYTSNCENAVDATQYRDVLILFRFNDHDLPFKLRQIIMADLRLLTLLEAGLPSWVIFLQSYPGFCHLYRPWMCPLARALYVLISIITVLIGFYDLYKNVPVLKATASRLCGPLLDWIETWEMISRIKYLGTMLFLHNFQKAVQWSLTIRRTTQSFLSVLTQPLAEPLVEIFGFLIPTWNMLIDLLESLCSLIWILAESWCSLVGDLVEILLLPVWFVLSTIWSIATSILYPTFWVLWEILYAPIRLVLALANLIAILCACICDTLGEIWQFFNGIFRVASATRTTVSTYEVSMWRSLWNDLFSQVFRALRSILNGFVAFFTACNRHRLSIYNHIQEFIRRLFGHSQRSRHEDPRRRRPKHESQKSRVAREVHIG
ncbi:uncharacterized protein LOC107417148 isoform X2 [Ziziphus jujuba]|uniref:Uncharacterized protein LOC107417148 isoform X2 n=1 Tax=Ziziphus jujuba TaxID=326968 RepID=A0ABM4A6K9_ZIZJJ|nr:uncharacterized protein LOC107417148 isoform X2 [Ziziphus jujuba]